MRSGDEYQIKDKYNTRERRLTNEPAAGSRRQRRQWRKAAVIAGGAMVVQAALSLPITVPLVPEASLARFGVD